MKVWPDLKKALKEGRRIDRQTLNKESDAGLWMALCMIFGIVIVAIAIAHAPQGGVTH